MAAARDLQARLAAADLYPWEAELKAWIKYARRVHDAPLARAPANEPSPAEGAPRPSARASRVSLPEWSPERGTPYHNDPSPGLRTTRSLLAASRTDRAYYLALLTGDGALLVQRRRYARLVYRLASKLPTTFPRQMLTSEAARDGARECVALLSTVIATFPLRKAAANEALAGGRLPDSHPNIAAELCTRYAALVRELVAAAETAATYALFPMRIESAVSIVANFETLRHPLSAAFRFLAGHQLALAQNVYATVKREWGQNKHPRDVLFTLLVEHAPPAYLERCLAAYAQLEAWWSANALKSQHASAKSGLSAGGASVVPPSSNPPSSAGDAQPPAEASPSSGRV